MANLVYIATSLDGYIADAGGSLDWLTSLPNPGNTDYGYAVFMRRIDAIVMGRATFETVLSFGEWPYKKPVFVLSRTLAALPEKAAGRASLLRGEPTEITRHLKALGYANLYIDGGRTIQAFLQADLIDELILTRIPILLGGGFPLFGRLESPLQFTHVRTQTWGEIVQSTYTRKKAGSPVDGNPGMTVN